MIEEQMKKLETGRVVERGIGFPFHVIRDGVSVWCEGCSYEAVGYSYNLSRRMVILTRRPNEHVSRWNGLRETGEFRDFLGNDWYWFEFAVNCEIHTMPPICPMQTEKGEVQS